MKILNKVISIIFCISFLSSGAQENKELRPDEISQLSIEELLSIKVKVSTTIPTSVFESPSPVTIIDHTLIDQYNFTTVAEAVRQVSGVEVLQTVIDKNVPTMRGILQNFYANKVLIMINNIPVWNPTYGNSTLDRININDVERIEVLKGPASVLYGTNAYTGVINIVLRKAHNNEINASISGGIPSTGNVAIHYGNNKGDFSWNISGGTSLDIRNPYKVNGFNDYDTTITDGDIYLYENDTLYNYTEEVRKQNINISLNYKSHSLLVNNFINSYTTQGVNASYKTGANKTITDKGTLISYSFEHKISSKTYFSANSYYDYHYRNQLISQAKSDAARFSSYRLGGSAKINQNINQYLNAEIGGEIYNGVNMGHEIIATHVDTVLNVNIKNKDGIIEGSTFVQLNFNYKFVTILSGLRYTQNNNFGSDLSPRITTQFKINPRNNIKLIYAQSFRTPSLLELYFDHWSINGNPNLKPEKCSSFEMVYTTNYKKLYGQITGYYSKYTNLIHRESDTINTNVMSRYENVGEFNSYGIETELRYQYDNVINAFANYNLCMSDDEGNKQNCRYVPSHTLALGISKPIKKFFISTNTYAYSQTEGYYANIEPQYTINAHLGYRHDTSKGFKLIHLLSVKNINNSDMLIPEYIRHKQNVNYLSTTGYGQSVIYTLKIKI